MSKCKVRGIMVGSLALMLITSGCHGAAHADNQNDILPVENLSLFHDDEFGGIFLKMSIDDFNSVDSYAVGALGFNSPRLAA